MKQKKFALVLAALLCMLMLFGCADSQETVSVDVEIGDEYYIATVRNILNNFDEHYGQTVRMEGVFWIHGVDTVYTMVMRKDFSC